MRYSLVAVAMFVLVGAMPQGKANVQTDKPLPVWKANAALLSKLGAEFTIDGYAIRPPRGYKMVSQKSGVMQANLWKGDVRDNGTAPGLVLLVSTPPPGEKKLPTIEQALDMYLADIERNRKEWQRTKAERGTVNGLTFVRARWSGTDLQRGFPVNGFGYVFTDGKAYYTIGGQDIRPNGVTTLPLLEAAALTFRKVEAKK